MADWLTVFSSFHHVKRLSARAGGTTGAPLIITLLGDDEPGAGQMNMAEITLFTDSDKLTEMMVDAINEAQSKRDEQVKAAQQVAA